MRIVLGSQSPRRLVILRAAVAPHHNIEVMPADIDEQAIRYPGASALTMAIARAKNEAVAARVDTDAVIVTADTVAVWDGFIREKPRSAEELAYFVKTYTNYKVDAVTSVWVHRVRTGWTGSVTDKATVYFHRFEPELVERIVEDRAFYASAGGFLIEHPLMKAKIKKIDGDPDTVQGFPGRLVGLLVSDALGE